MLTSNTFIRYAFWIMLGIAIGITSLVISPQTAFVQESSATPTLSADRLDAVLEKGHEVGSTDGIVFMVVIIVLIVMIPIMLRRNAWSNGGRKKKTTG